MKYSVEGDGSNVNITVDAPGAQQHALMEELNECAEGRCSCPTPQYAKVQSMQITPRGSGVTITLKAKTGETVDHGDIKKCLDHTTRKVANSGEHAPAQTGDPI
jgi:hypothetical protein